jgi:hypothetical protein
MNRNSEIDTGRAVTAGVAAGSAYLGAMWLDNKLSSQEYNDIKLVGQFFTTKSPWWVIQGLAGHYSFSIFMALLYAKVGRSKLPGPDLLKGILFLNIENALLYPAGLIVDNIHAGIKQGEVPPMLTRKSFFGQVTRHIAFGAVLGLLCKPEV